MPTLVKPRAKPKGQPARRSNVWHICFWDRSKKRTRLFSTMCRRKRNAEKRLRRFIDMLEDGTYYREFAPRNPFLVEIERSQQQQQDLAMDCVLSDYEAALRAGKVRKRLKGKPPGEDYCNSTMARLRKMFGHCLLVTDVTPVVVDRAISRYANTQL